MSISIFDSPTTDPALNLAIEEILMHRKKDDYMFFYINAPSVIVGKHQNTFREVNLTYTEKERIPVFRRLSGGGAVFHDEGNLNFSFILNGTAGKMVDFGKYMEPVVRYIQSLGIDVEKDKRHNLRINGLKISGNAEHIFKNRVLHHGTLLFSSRLDRLNHCLEPPAGMFTDKAISSERSRVTNLADHLQEKMEIKQFRTGLLQYCKKYFNASDPCGKILTKEDNPGKLAAEKYRTWNWNFGYSPDFTFKHTEKLQGKNYTVVIAVQKGKISNIELTGDEKEDFTYLCRTMKGLRYNRQEITGILNRPAGKGISSATMDEWISLIFPEK